MSFNNLNPALTSIVQEIGQCEGGFVADKLFPITRVSSCSFSWIDWKCTNQYDVANDKVGCYSQRNEIDPQIFEYKHDKVQQRYLDTVICELELSCHNNAGCNNPSFDLEAMRVADLFGNLRLAREVRAISAAFDQTKYVVGQQGGGGITDMTGFESNPDALKQIAEIIACKDGGYNCLVVNKKVATKLIFHPAFKNLNCCDGGLKTTLDAIAGLMGLQEIVISDAKINQAAAGLPKDIQTLLDDTGLLVNNAPMPGTDCPRRVFGFTAQYRDTFAARYADMASGGRGNLRLVAGWDIKEVVADYSQAELLINLCK